MTAAKTAPVATETDLLKRLENLEAELEHAFDQIGRLKRSAPLGFGFGKVVQLWVVPDASNGRLSFCLDKTGRQSLPFTSLAGTLRLANFPDRGNLGATLELNCSSFIVQLESSYPVDAIIRQLAIAPPQRHRVVSLSIDNSRSAVTLEIQ
ncbi:hypothetical protein IFO70_32835 [Phormidium tenue FACHB-886]|nr:hypothetical protein [Phormidium tenue FACHB-886]